MQTLLLTGTRQLEESQTQALRTWLQAQHFDLLLCGGAKGTDAVATAVAQEMGKKIVAIKPDYTRYHVKTAPILRNQELIKEAVRLGARVVAYQPNGLTKGTQDTIRRALAAGLPVEEWRGGNEWIQHQPAATLGL